MTQVLVIDDQELMQQTLKAILSNEGYKVNCAKSGKEGLKLAKEEQHDLVLVDYHMPELKGAAVVQLLRSLPNYKNIPFVMVTGETDELKMAQAQKAGISGWVSKPISADNLLPTIKKVLGLEVE